MDISEKYRTRIRQQNFLDGFIGMNNIPGDGKEDTTEGTNQKIGQRQGSPGIEL
jgi:hypothetical protein